MYLNVATVVAEHLRDFWHVIRALDFVWARWHVRQLIDKRVRQASTLHHVPFLMRVSNPRCKPRWDDFDGHIHLPTRASASK